LAIHPAIDPLEADKMRQAADLLLDARRTLQPIADLPADLRPRSLEAAYFVQTEMAIALAPIGGWKVGAQSPTATPTFCPMPLIGGFAASGSLVKSTFHRLRGVEAEIAFLLGSDLPPRSTPYSREEVTAAIASCHPAIEILESAFEDPDKVDRLSVIADLQINGGFAYGDPADDWRSIDFAQQTATLSIDGVIRVEATASNSGGTDLLRLVTWLANEGQSRTGGLLQGDWITTGNWTGKTFAQPGSAVLARFTSCREVSLYFE
jgi:2-keto-4-pentenoate hydratase